MNLKAEFKKNVLMFILNLIQKNLEIYDFQDNTVAFCKILCQKKYTASPSKRILF